MPNPAAQPRTRKPWLRRASVALAVVLAGVLFYLTRPSTLARLILPVASAAVGGDVSASRISLGGINSIVFEDLRVRTRGWEGRAGELVYANRIEARFSLLSLLAGSFRVRSVHADQLTLRLVEDADDAGRFSFQSLTPRAAEPDTGGGAPERPAEFRVDDLVIENLLTGEGGLREVGELRFRGGLTPDAESPTAFHFDLRGRPDRQGRLTIAGIEGTFDPATQAIALTVEDLLVDGRELTVAPIAVRAWTGRLGLEGRVKSARFEYAPDTEPSALIDLEGLAMNIPIDELSGDALVDTWGGFSRGAAVDLDATPRMTLRTGTLRLERNEVRFEHITGELGADGGDGRVLPVPFTGTIAMRVPAESLPPFDWEARDEWFESAARIAPFSIDLAVRGFRSSESDAAPDTLFLPREAVKILSDFQVTAWTIDVDTRLERGDPDAEGKPAPLRSSGHLRLADGSGAFEEFPYRLDGVRGSFRYDNDDLAVEEITGTGADGAEVRISGSLIGLSTGAEIDLQIVCTDAPIDERLFNSFEEAPREALGLLFDARAAKSLGEAGLLPDAGALVNQRQQLARLGDDARNASDRARLQRSLDAGPFTLGGRCGFAMRVHSPAGFGQPVFVTGDVTVRDAGLVFGRFPYPLRLKEGSFRVLDEAIEIVDPGITAVTPAGGLFTVSGRVEIPRLGDGTRGTRPLISIADREDAINPALLAAIPHADSEMPDGWPGTDLAPAGELLASLGLKGRIGLDGLIDSDEEDHERFSIVVDFDEGTAAPDESGRAQLAEIGLAWPRDFTLRDCFATIRLTPERVSIEECTGRNGDGTVSASGYADLDGPDREIAVELKSIPISRAFESYLAPDAETAAARFDRFAPGGEIDGVIRRVVRADHSETSGSLTPRVIELTLDGSRVRAERIAGRIAVDAKGLRAESLEYRLSEAGIDDGILRLSGALGEPSVAGPAPAATGVAGDGAEDRTKDARATDARATDARATEPPAPATQLEASLTGTRLESPLVRELLAERAQGVLDALRARAARGVFDATYLAGDAERFEIRPKWLTVGESGEEITLRFGDGDLIQGVADKVDLQVAAKIAGDPSSSVTLKGTYTANGDSRITAAMRITASALTPALRTQLPPPLDTSAAAIGLTTTGRFDLELTEIALRWPSSGSAAEPDIYQLLGKTVLEDARFDAGLAFEGVDAELPLRLRYEPRAAKPVDFTAKLDASGGRALDRPFGHSDIAISTGPKGDTLEITGAGDIAFGRFDLTGSVDFEADRYAMRVRIADADYDALRLSSPLTAETPRSVSRLSGVVELGGAYGEGVDRTETRSGSGKVTIRNATLASLPVAMRVLQLTQLMLPVSSTISAADADFAIRGNTADITRCELLAGTIQLGGTGTLDIPSFSIGLRLFPRGTVPIVSDVIGGVTNQFFAIDVAGPLADPKATLAPLPGITEMPTPGKDSAKDPAKEPATPAVPPPPSAPAESSTAPERDEQ